ncbi:MAG TPA: hypothetical protein VH639_06325 [Bryobacteraceae bacterium]
MFRLFRLSALLLAVGFILAAPGMALVPHKPGQKHHHNGIYWGPVRYSSGYWDRRGNFHMYGHFDASGRYHPAH